MATECSLDWDNYEPGFQYDYQVQLVPDLLEPVLLGKNHQDERDGFYTPEEYSSSESCYESDPGSSFKSICSTVYFSFQGSDSGLGCSEDVRKTLQRLQQTKSKAKKPREPAGSKLKSLKPGPKPLCWQKQGFSCVDYEKIEFNKNLQLWKNADDGRTLSFSDTNIGNFPKWKMPSRDSLISRYQNSSASLVELELVDWWNTWVVEESSRTRSTSSEVAPRRQSLSDTSVNYYRLTSVKQLNSSLGSSGIQVPTVSRVSEIPDVSPQSSFMKWLENVQDTSYDVAAKVSSGSDLGHLSESNSDSNPSLHSDTEVDKLLAQESVSDTVLSQKTYGTFVGGKEVCPTKLLHDTRREISRESPEVTTDQGSLKSPSAKPPDEEDFTQIADELGKIVVKRAVEQYRNEVEHEQTMKIPTFVRKSSFGKRNEEEQHVTIVNTTDKAAEVEPVRGHQDESMESESVEEESNEISGDDVNKDGGNGSARCLDSDPDKTCPLQEINGEAENWVSKSDAVDEAMSVGGSNGIVLEQTVAIDKCLDHEIDKVEKSTLGLVQRGRNVDDDSYQSFSAGFADAIVKSANRSMSSEGTEVMNAKVEGVDLEGAAGGIVWMSLTKALQHFIQDSSRNMSQGEILELLKKSVCQGRQGQHVSAVESLESDVNKNVVESHRDLQTDIGTNGKTTGRTEQWKPEPEYEAEMARPEAKGSEENLSELARDMTECILKVASCKASEKVNSLCDLELMEPDSTLVTTTVCAEPAEQPVTSKKPLGEISPAAGRVYTRPQSRDPVSEIISKPAEKMSSRPEQIGAGLIPKHKMTDTSDLPQANLCIDSGVMTTASDFMLPKITQTSQTMIARDELLHIFSYSDLLSKTAVKEGTKSAVDILNYAEQMSEQILTSALSEGFHSSKWNLQKCLPSSDQEPRGLDGSKSNVAFIEDFADDLAKEIMSSAFDCLKTEMAGVASKVEGDADEMVSEFKLKEHFDGEPSSSGTSREVSQGATLPENKLVYDEKLEVDSPEAKPVISDSSRSSYVACPVSEEYLQPDEQCESGSSFEYETSFSSDQEFPDESQTTSSNGTRTLKGDYVLTEEAETLIAGILNQSSEGSLSFSSSSQDEELHNLRQTESSSSERVTVPGLPAIINEAIELPSLGDGDIGQGSQSTLGWHEDMPNLWTSGYSSEEQAVPTPSVFAEDNQSLSTSTGPDVESDQSGNTYNQSTPTTGLPESEDGVPEASSSGGQYEQSTYISSCTSCQTNSSSRGFSSSENGLSKSASSLTKSGESGLSLSSGSSNITSHSSLPVIAEDSNESTEKTHSVEMKFSQSCSTCTCCCSGETGSCSCTSSSSVEENRDGKHPSSSVKVKSQGSVMKSCRCCSGSCLCTGSSSSFSSSGLNQSSSTSDLSLGLIAGRPADLGTHELHSGSSESNTTADYRELGDISFCESSASEKVPKDVFASLLEKQARECLIDSSDLSELNSDQDSKLAGKNVESSEFKYQLFLSEVQDSGQNLLESHQDDGSWLTKLVSKVESVTCSSQTGSSDSNLGQGSISMQSHSGMDQRLFSTELKQILSTDGTLHSDNVNNVSASDAGMFDSRSLSKYQESVQDEGSGGLLKLEPESGMNCLKVSNHRESAAIQLSSPFSCWPNSVVDEGSLGKFNLENSQASDPSQSASKIDDSDSSQYNYVKLTSAGTSGTRWTDSSNRNFPGVLSSGVTYEGHRFYNTMDNFQTPGNMFKYWSSPDSADRLPSKGFWVPETNHTDSSDSVEGSAEMCAVQTSSGRRISSDVSSSGNRSHSLRYGRLSGQIPESPLAALRREWQSESLHSENSIRRQWTDHVTAADSPASGKFETRKGLTKMYSSTSSNSNEDSLQTRSGVESSSSTSPSRDFALKSPNQCSILSSSVLSSTQEGLSHLSLDNLPSGVAQAIQVTSSNKTESITSAQRTSDAISDLVEMDNVELQRFKSAVMQTSSTESYPALGVIKSRKSWELRNMNDEDVSSCSAASGCSLQDQRMENRMKSLKSPLSVELEQLGHTSTLVQTSSTECYPALHTIKSRPSWELRNLNEEDLSLDSSMPECSQPKEARKVETHPGRPTLQNIPLSVESKRLWEKQEEVESLKPKKPVVRPQLRNVMKRDNLPMSFAQAIQVPSTETSYKTESITSTQRASHAIIDLSTDILSLTNADELPKKPKLDSYSVIESRDHMHHESSQDGNSDISALPSPCDGEGSFQKIGIFPLNWSDDKTEGAETRYLVDDNVLADKVREEKCQLLSRYQTYQLDTTPRPESLTRILSTQTSQIKESDEKKRQLDQLQQVRTLFLSLDTRYLDTMRKSCSSISGENAPPGEAKEEVIVEQGLRVEKADDVMESAEASRLEMSPSSGVVDEKSDQKSEDVGFKFEIADDQIHAEPELKLKTSNGCSLGENSQRSDEVMSFDTDSQGSEAVTSNSRTDSLKARSNLTSKASSEVSSSASSELTAEGSSEHTKVSSKSTSDMSLVETSHTIQEITFQASLELISPASSKLTSEDSLEETPQTNPELTFQASSELSFQASSKLTSEDSLEETHPQVSLELTFKTSPEVIYQTSSKLTSADSMEKSFQTSPKHTSQASSKVTSDDSLDETPQMNLECTSQVGSKWASKDSLEETPQTSTGLTSQTSSELSSQTSSKLISKDCWEESPQTNLEHTSGCILELSSQASSQLTSRDSFVETPQTNLEPTSQTSPELTSEPSSESTSQSSSELSSLASSKLISKDSLEESPQTNLEHTSRCTLELSSQTSSELTSKDGSMATPQISPELPSQLSPELSSQASSKFSSKVNEESSSNSSLKTTKSSLEVVSVTSSEMMSKTSSEAAPRDISEHPPRSSSVVTSESNLLRQSSDRTTSEFISSECSVIESGVSCESSSKGTSESTSKETSAISADGILKTEQSDSSEVWRRPSSTPEVVPADRKASSTSADSFNWSECGNVSDASLDDEIKHEVRKCAQNMEESEAWDEPPVDSSCDVSVSSCGAGTEQRVNILEEVEPYRRDSGSGLLMTEPLCDDSGGKGIAPLSKSGMTERVQVLKEPEPSDRVSSLGSMREPVGPSVHDDVTASVCQSVGAQQSGDNSHKVGESVQKSTVQNASKDRLQDLGVGLLRPTGSDSSLEEEVVVNIRKCRQTIQEEESESESRCLTGSDVNLDVARNTSCLDEDPGLTEELSGVDGNMEKTTIGGGRESGMNPLKKQQSEVRPLKTIKTDIVANSNRTLKGDNILEKTTTSDQLLAEVDDVELQRLKSAVIQTSSTESYPALGVVKSRKSWELRNMNDEDVSSSSAASGCSLQDQTMGNRIKSLKSPLSVELEQLGHASTVVQTSSTESYPGLHTIKSRPSWELGNLNEDDLSWESSTPECSQSNLQEERKMETHPSRPTLQNIPLSVESKRLWEKQEEVESLKPKKPVVRPQLRNVMKRDVLKVSKQPPNECSDKVTSKKRVSPRPKFEPRQANRFVVDEMVIGQEGVSKRKRDSVSRPRGKVSSFIQFSSRGKSH